MTTWAQNRVTMRSTTRLASLLLCLVFSIAPIAAQDTTQPRCYFPDGSIDTAGYICNTTAAETGVVSACCLHNDACYESGTCFQDWSGVMYRQSCTDPTWRDPKCPQMCLGKGQLDLGVWVQTCDVANGKACCVEDNECCNDTANWFDYRPGYLVAVISGDGSNRLGPYIAADAVASSSSSASSSFSSTRAPTGGSPASSPGEATAAASTSFTDTTTTSTNTVAIAVGVVFGTGFALACAGLLFFLMRFLREKRQRLDTAEQLTQLQHKLIVMTQEPKALGYGQPSFHQTNQQHQQYPYGQAGPPSEMPDSAAVVSELAAGERAWPGISPGAGGRSL